MIRSRRTRRQDGVKWRLKKPEWIDPFPHIPGTRPEKRIFAALVARRIYFIFQGDFLASDSVSPLLQSRNFKPDFLIPEYKVIVDPFGDFHHSKIEAIESDAIKSVDYEARGYEFVHPWSSEVEAHGGHWVLQQSANLRLPPRHPLPKSEWPYRAQGYRLGPNLGLGTKGVAAANRKRAKPKVLKVKTRRR